MKKYDNPESVALKFLRKYILGCVSAILTICVIISVCIKSNDESKEEHKGSYHDYNHAIIIIGKEGTTVELDSYSRTITDKYVLYTKDGKVYECPVNNVIFYNE